MQHPHEYCNRWFNEGRSRNVHPVTGHRIDPDSSDWNDIEEACSDFMYDQPIGEMKHASDSVYIPQGAELCKDIQDLVKMVWPNFLVNKRSSYESTDGASDLFSRPHMDLPHVVCPSMVAEGWRDLLSIDDRKDVMKHTTSFVTSYMLGSITTRLRFLKLVSYAFKVLFETIHTVYGDDRFMADSIFLVLKGGMALRMNILEMIRAFSSEMEGFMVDLLHAELKLSDFDFEVISSGLTKDEVTRLNVVTFMVTMQIRNHIEDNREYYLDFFQYSEVHQRKLIATLHHQIEHACSQLPETSFFQNITIDHIAFGGDVPPINTAAYVDRNTSSSARSDRSDFALVVDGRTHLPVDDRSDLCFIAARQLLCIHYAIPEEVVNRLCRRSLLFVSHNPLIAFSEGTVNSAFQLNRIKYGFKIYFQRQGALLQDYFPGELLDVSHQLHNDTRRTWNKNDRRHPLYHLSSIRHIKDLRFNTLTPYGQIQEHRFMLFKAVHFPWHVDKYEKRIVRLLCIFFLFVFSAQGPRYSFNRKLSLMDILKKDIENQTLNGILPPFIMRQLRSDVVDVFLRHQPDHSVEASRFRTSILEMLSTLIRIFSHEYKRSRNLKLTIKEYDPLVFNKLFNGEE
jgi:hypothetical protein